MIAAMTLKCFAGAGAVLACVAAAQRNAPTSAADMLVVNGRVYTLAWDEPDREGPPAATAPHAPGGWHPDAQAVAIRGDRTVRVGTTAQAVAPTAPETKIVDAGARPVVPGLAD